LYIGYFKDILPGDETLRLLLAGAILGLLVAIIAIFWVDIPSIVGLTGNLRYLPLLGAPIVYGVLWWLVIKPLNNLVGIEEE